LNIRNVVSIHHSKTPIAGVTVYGVVRSFTRPQRLNHGVVKVGRRFYCSCEDFLYRHVKRGTCKHIRAAKAKLVRTARFKYGTAAHRRAHNLAVRRQCDRANQNVGRR